ncbi:zinc finger protein ZAT4-like [Zingiber officinale]|uniref:C2H2-type domain-containing protein n=1 Tax=Zingiber officinale TaxID=94328 RepID=A0A8J5I5A9_ZINOF|nr:zinc finger protein ZAT4-like [Zingiber officinale]KAG6537456.1 hypothetical protein ZIOFF_002550 [Zingiber officinale]
MEGDRPPAHPCKVCQKSFPSGQSLGGHMRSHHNISADAGGKDPRTPPGSYRLRANPKKTWRMSDAGDGADAEKRCGECGKEFLTWRALFGHCECHFLKPEPDRQTDCRIASAAISPGRRMRMPAMASCSFSSSDYEREDEDGAIGLMMLSRDCRRWDGGGSEGSSESSVKEAELDLPRKGIKKTKVSHDQFAGDLDLLKNQKIYSFPADEFKCSSSEVSGKGFPRKRDRKNNSDSISLGATFQLDDQRSQFQCVDCKNTFQSYQALGGHRASHKRTNGCRRSKIDSAHRIANEEETVDGGEVSEASFESTKKRCHLMIQQQPLEMANLFDLNFPAGVDGDAELDSCFSVAYQVNIAS